MCREFSRKCSDMVKGLAILLLLNYHLFEDGMVVAQMQVDYRPLPEQVFVMLSKFGNVSVSVFVFLTAFGITKGLMGQEHVRPDAMYRQAVGRMLRLMGNFAALYVSVALVWWSRFDFASLYGEGKQGFLYMLADGIGLAQILDTPTLNMTWWYMKIAYVLIFLVPLLYLLAQKVGSLLLPIVFFAPAAFVLDPDMERYFLTAAVGVCAAYGSWLDKLLGRKLHPVLRWCAGIGGIVLCVLVRQNFFVQERLLFLVDAVIALFLAWFAAALPGSVPGVGRALAFVGRYSMNIYMVHTFFYMILWRRYIYFVRYAGAILVVLLLVSLLYSVVLEWVKKWVKKGAESAVRLVRARVKGR